MTNTEQKNTTPTLKPGQRLSINGNIVEGYATTPSAPPEKLPTPESGDMNASRLGGAQ
jgi:hypothetical protein